MLIAVSLYFWGDELSPSHVTEMLGVNPSQHQYKGEQETTSTKKTIVAKTGMWGFSTDYELHSMLLDEHLSYLQSKFDTKWKEIGQLNNVQKSCVDIYIGMDADAGDETECEFEISPKNLTNLQQLGIPLRFTVTFTE